MNSLRINTGTRHIAKAGRTTGRLSDIETKGFAVVRDFLSHDEIDTIMQDYHAGQTRNQSDDFQISRACSQTFAMLHDRMMSVSEDVGKVTSTDVDVEQGGEYFSISNAVTFPWRQNETSFYLNQNHYNYLNFYMILSKDKREEASVGLIPFDRLKAMSPDCYYRIVGGAGRFVVQNERTNIYGIEEGKKWGTLPYDIGTLSESHYLRAGDLLLMRGDVIHQLQHSDSGHIILAMRMANSQNRIRLKRMVSGSWPKIVVMMNNRRTFSRIFNAFEKLNAREASYLDLINKYLHDNSPAPSKFNFIIRLLKLRFQLMFSMDG